MREKIVLAFSGGLDTSYCVKYLSEDLGYDVYSAVVNTGGFDEAEITEIAEKAQKLGVIEHVTIDVRDQYYQECIRYMIMGNILKNNTYPLSVSSERIFQAMGIVEFAKKVGATKVAHGSTGAGNDQVRFDLAFQVAAPEIEILTPIRDMQLSRQEEIDFLIKHGVEGDWVKAAYSINKGIWGTSVGGKETLSSHQTLPDDAYPSPLTKDGSEDLSIEFVKGEISKVNGQAFADPIDAINKVNELGAAYAIGRDVHVGDTIIGIKGRVGFEAAGPLMIIKAHHLLEKHVLSKWQMHWKEQLSSWYGMLLHEAQHQEPVMRNIEAFIVDTQSNVSGTVFLKLHPYRFELVGIESKYDLMQAKFGQYGEMNNAWTGDDVRGFTKILANSMKIHSSVNGNDE